MILFCIVEVYVESKLLLHGYGLEELRKEKKNVADLRDISEIVEDTYSENGLKMCPQRGQFVPNLCLIFSSSA